MAPEHRRAAKPQRRSARNVLVRDLKATQREGIGSASDTASEGRSLNKRRPHWPQRYLARAESSLRVRQVPWLRRTWESVSKRAERRRGRSQARGVGRRTFWRVASLQSPLDQLARTETRMASNLEATTLFQIFTASFHQGQSGPRNYAASTNLSRVLQTPMSGSRQSWSSRRCALLSPH